MENTGRIVCISIWCTHNFIMFKLMLYHHLHHKNGDKLDFPVFLHHCLNPTKLGSLECVEMCLQTVWMSDEVRYYPMKMIIHIKI